MKNTYNIFMIFLAALMLVSCSTVSVTTDYDKTTSFSQYKTFDFYQLTDKSGSVSDLNKNRIIKAIKTDLLSKGFTQTSSNPDLLVNITTILEDKKRVIAQTDYYGYGGYYRPYSWGGRYAGFAPPATTSFNVYDYKDGSLIIDIIDTSKKQLVWQGTGNKEIDKPSDDPDTTINEAVTKIMESFPPGTKK
jgi:Domain of unknown function (DUF4136)